MNHFLHRIDMRGFDRATAATLLATLVLAAGCSHPEADCCRVKPPAAAAATTVALPDRSVYQLASRWTDDGGKELRLSDLRGRPQVVVMFFASCQVACPILVHDLKRLEAALPESLKGGVGVVLVSIDPTRDTVAALHAYRGHQHLPADWTLLRGGDDDVLELAAVLGVNYKREDSGQFAHSNLITLLDREGQVAVQVQGLNQAVEPLVQEIRKMVAR